MREVDKRECALSGVTPKRALRFGFLHGQATTVFDDGVPIAVFGVVPQSILTGDAIVWALSTDRTVGRAREWLVFGRYWAERVIAAYPRARNRVHRDNGLAIRWLTHIGFEVAPATTDSEFRDFSACAIR